MAEEVRKLKQEAGDQMLITLVAGFADLAWPKNYGLRSDRVACALAFLMLMYWRAPLEEAIP